MYFKFYISSFPNKIPNLHYGILFSFAIWHVYYSLYQKTLFFFLISWISIYLVFKSFFFYSGLVLWVLIYHFGCSKLSVSPFLTALLFPVPRVGRFSRVVWKFCLGAHLLWLFIWEKLSWRLLTFAFVSFTFTSARPCRGHCSEASIHGYFSGWVYRRPE